MLVDFVTANRMTSPGATVALPDTVSVPLNVEASVVVMDVSVSLDTSPTVALYVTVAAPLPAVSTKMDMLTIFVNPGGTVQPAPNVDARLALPTLSHRRAESVEMSPAL